MTSPVINKAPSAWQVGLKKWLKSELTTSKRRSRLPGTPNYHYTWLIKTAKSWRNCYIFHIAAIIWRELKCISSKLLVSLFRWNLKVVWKCQFIIPHKIHLLGQENKQTQLRVNNFCQNYWLINLRLFKQAVRWTSWWPFSTVCFRSSGPAWLSAQKRKEVIYSWRQHHLVLCKYS